MKTLALALALLPLAATATHAGPWAQGKGHGYYELTWSTLSTDKLATPDGAVHEVPTFDQREWKVYGEYGLSDRWTLIGSFPVDHFSSIDGFGSASGVGDLRLGARWQLAASGPWVYALRGHVQLPTGDETKGEALLPTGSGAVEAQGWIGIGRSIPHGWVHGEAGYQARGEDLHDGIVYEAELGFHAGSRLDLSFKLNGVEPFESGVSLGSAAGLGDGVTYFKYGPSGTFELGGGVGILGAVEWTAHAANLARGVTYRAGLTLKR